jgi:hypothetical protein
MIWFVTLDTTLSTLDSTTAFTWDADAIARNGFVLWQDSTGSWSYIVGNARAESISFDREMLRNPFGSVWFQAGSGRPGPQLLRVTGEVWSVANDGIVTAAGDVNAVQGSAEDAVLVKVIFGDYDVLALQSFARTPIEAGYRVDMVFVTASGRN